MPGAEWEFKLKDVKFFIEVFVQIQTFVCNPFQENAYLVWDAEKNAIFIDPGFYDDGEFARAENFICENGLHLHFALNTHLHLDHCIGNAKVANRLHIPVKASAKDFFLIENAERQAQMFGLDLEDVLPLPTDSLKDGEEFAFGNLRVRILETPGHSPGGLSFYFAKEKVLFSGDTLFRDSFGRTDLPLGDENALVRSIREKLLSLPDEVVVFPGHGGRTTVLREKANWKVGSGM